MNRILTMALAVLMLTGVAGSAAAATWRLVQPSGEKVSLTVTDTVIRIAGRDGTIEIPVARVQSVRVTTRYLDPFAKWESWMPEGHDRRATLPLDAIADNGGAGIILLIGAGALATAGVASLVDPEGFVHLTWLDGEVTRSTNIRTGFFTPFVERRLRDAGIR